LTYTFVSDGSSDKILIPILTWALKQSIQGPIVSQWADFGRIPRQPNIQAKLAAALDLYPCDLLFVHRDSEGQPPEWRREEIAKNLKQISTAYVPVVPVRMSEAWLLFDESSIRSAAGNPNGIETLVLPDLTTLEDVLDPKKLLHDVLVRASGKNAHRRSRFPVRQRVHLITNYIDDYSPLQSLSAFRNLQEDIQQIFRQ